MGLKVAPSVFARLMQKVLRPFLGRFCVTYLDDINVYSNSWESLNVMRWRVARGKSSTEGSP